jgi:hypothetical protein
VAFVSDVNQEYVPKLPDTTIAPTKALPKNAFFNLIMSIPHYLL